MENAPISVVSPFPLPPEYYKNFTNQIIKNGQVPNPPPIPLKYTIFGEQVDWSVEKEKSLNELGIKQMYDGNGDFKAELKKLNNSIMSTYLDLMDILIRCPADPMRGEKIELLKTLFINFHHILNLLRPVQARDVIVATSLEQVEDLSMSTQKMNAYLTTAKTIVISTIDKALQDAKQLEDDLEIVEKERLHSNLPTLHHYKKTIKLKSDGRKTADDHAYAMKREEELLKEMELL
uniref:Mediator of RNA polymerase II transcription subunit 7 n=1 Tax=Rhabditophanes sp. KR3021 TaxID=114890 RepID=A0AC35U0L1_9BILA